MKTSLTANRYSNFAQGLSQGLRIAAGKRSPQLQLRATRVDPVSIFYRRFSTAYMQNEKLRPGTTHCRPDSTPSEHCLSGGHLMAYLPIRNLPKEARMAIPLVQDSLEFMKDTLADYYIEALRPAYERELSALNLSPQQLVLTTYAHPMIFPADDKESHLYGFVIHVIVAARKIKLCLPTLVRRSRQMYYDKRAAEQAVDD